jgi:hypothetical protein
MSMKPLITAVYHETYRKPAENFVVVEEEEEDIHMGKICSSLMFSMS